MELKTYLKQFKGKQRKQFCEAVDCNYDYLSMVANGHRKAGGKLCAAIQRESGGQVTTRDLRPDWFPDEIQPEKTA